MGVRDGAAVGVEVGPEADWGVSVGVTETGSDQGPGSPEALTART